MQRLFTMIFIATLFCSSIYALGQQKTHSARILSGTPGTVQFDLKGHTEYVKDVRWSPDGTKLATVSGGALDNSAIVWSAVTGEKLYTLPYAKYISWSPDGSKIATINSDTTVTPPSNNKILVVIWSAASGEKIVSIKAHTASIAMLSWSPDGSKIATASADKTASIWSTTNPGMPLVLNGHSKQVTHGMESNGEKAVDSRR
ncbi:MAG: PD40 domain-containing protein [Lewinellaceae bacterium]|nr:PD40 domain-containing protein [Lewinellaceae bacterium]